mgnify:CR=1 FL=1
MAFKNKHLKFIVTALYILCGGFIMAVIFIAISNVGIGSAIFFILAVGMACQEVTLLSERYNTPILGILMVLIILIIACIIVWNAAFPIE